MGVADLNSSGRVDTDISPIPELAGWPSCSDRLAGWTSSSPLKWTNVRVIPFSPASGSARSNCVVESFTVATFRPTGNCTECQCITGSVFCGTGSWSFIVNYRALEFRSCNVLPGKCRAELFGPDTGPNFELVRVQIMPRGK